MNYFRLLSSRPVLFLLAVLVAGIAAAMWWGVSSSYEGFTEGVENQQDASGNTAATTAAGGSNYDNYDHFRRAIVSVLPSGATFFGPDGGKAFVTASSDGTQMLKILLGGRMQTYTLNANDNNPSVFFGPNGNRATVIDRDGQKAVQLSTAMGNFLYTITGTPNSYDQDTTTSTQYYGSTGSPIQKSMQFMSYGDPSVTERNKAYYDSLPRGVPRSEIPAGDEDLYILKSQVVPPVCPACPAVASSNREQCPPCPPCARCPEPSFECKKVPNFNLAPNEYLPVPVVSDFSSFGM